MPHSKFLVHWSGKDLESLADDDKLARYGGRLKDWYQNGLFAKRTIDPELAIRIPGPSQVNKLKNKEFVRLCFTEVRLSQAEKHSQLYGRLGIGFTSEYIANKGGRPVIYNPWEAKGRSLEESIYRAWEKAEAQGNHELEQLLGSIVAFCKLMSEESPLGSGFFKNNYEEMEWRIVYGGTVDTIGTFTANGNDESECYRMKFNPGDVALIVFPNRDVMQRTLDDNQMKIFFAIHQPNLLLVEDCGDF